MTLSLFDRLPARATPSDAPLVVALVDSVRLERPPAHRGEQATSDFEVQAMIANLLAATRAPDALPLGPRLLQRLVVLHWSPAFLALVAERLAFRERPARPAPARTLSLGESRKAGDELARYAAHAERVEMRCGVYAHLRALYDLHAPQTSALAVARALSKGIGSGDYDDAVESYAARAMVAVSIVAARRDDVGAVAHNAGAFLHLAGRLHGGIHFVQWALSSLLDRVRADRSAPR